MGRKKGGPPEPGQKRLHLVLGIPLSLISGCLVFLAFPTYDLFPLQWFSLVPLLLSARGRGFWGGLFLGFLAGLSTNLGGFYWISHVLRDFGHMTPTPAWALTVLVAAYQALVFAFATGFTAYVVAKVGRDVLWFFAFPFIFTTCEYLVPFIFPWYFANGQYLFYAVTQIVEALGISSLTFLIVLVNVVFTDMVWALIYRMSFPWFRLFTSVAVFAVAIAYGVKRIGEVDEMVRSAPRMRVALIEPDVGIWEKEAKGPDGKPLPPEDQVRVLYRNLLKHHILSAKAEAEGSPDLIVWPESSYMPFRGVLHRATDREAVVAFSDGRFGFVTLLGKLMVDPKSRLTGVKGLCAASENRVFGVGQKGVAYYFDKSAWVHEPTGTDRSLVAVACNENLALAVGEQGSLALRTGDKWGLLESGVTENLNAVTLVLDTFVAVGDKGVVLRINGKKVSRIALDSFSDLLSVSYSERSGLWIGGREGLWKGDLRHLARQDFPGGAVVSVAAGPETLVVDEKGDLYRCTEVCERVRLENGEKVRAVTGDGEGLFFVLGRSGQVFKMRAGEKPNLIEGVEGSASVVAFIPFSKGYPLPKGVKALYVASEKVSGADIANLAAIEDRDKVTADRDRNAAMRGFKTPLIFGAITMEPDPQRPGERIYYNTALLLSPDGRILGTYDKNYLLIFGEYLPFSDWFPFLHDWFPEAGNFKPGQSVEVFELNGTRIGVMICYEDIIPAFSRQLHAKSPHILVNITNDAWFGKTTEPYQHLALATFRSIENRRFLVRVTNTGVSAVIDPVGRIVNETSLDNPEYIVAEVAKMEGETPYQRYGDLFAWASCGISALFLLVGFLRRKS